MKKVILALVACSALTFASESTIDATMKLMKQGMDQIQLGFMYNSKDDIKRGIDTVENSNAIFKHVKVSDFMKSNKTAVATNINKNMTKDLKALKEAVNSGKYNEATKQYGKVLNECLSCHTIIRGW